MEITGYKQVINAVKILSGVTDTRAWWM